MVDGWMARESRPGISRQRAGRRLFGAGPIVHAAEASDAVWPRATWDSSAGHNIGRRQRRRISSTVFRVGWAVLQRDVSMVAARLLDALGLVQTSDRDLQFGLRALARELRKHAKAGAPWRRGPARRPRVARSSGLGGADCALRRVPVMLANVSARTTSDRMRSTRRRFSSSPRPRTLPPDRRVPPVAPGGAHQLTEFRARIGRACPPPLRSESDAGVSRHPRDALERVRVAFAQASRDEAVARHWRSSLPGVALSDVKTQWYPAGSTPPPEPYAPPLTASLPALPSTTQRSTGAPARTASHAASASPSRCRLTGTAATCSRAAEG